MTGRPRLFSIPLIDKIGRDRVCRGLEMRGYSNPPIAMERWIQRRYVSFRGRAALTEIAHDHDVTVDKDDLKIITL